MPYSSFFLSAISYRLSSPERVNHFHIPWYGTPSILPARRHGFKSQQATKATKAERQKRNKCSNRRGPLGRNVGRFLFGQSTDAHLEDPGLVGRPVPANAHRHFRTSPSLIEEQPFRRQQTTTKTTKQEYPDEISRRSYGRNNTCIPVHLLSAQNDTARDIRNSSIPA